MFHRASGKVRIKFFLITSIVISIVLTVLLNLILFVVSLLAR